ncbi:glycosyl hydrolase [Caulobacter sp. SSI4214]|uniref:glycosyl hydrolase n=1 Tax=Caulobacter sp. SSI4214 TaxID=2575739 RepID=UPI0023AAE7A0|nr:glycosyl hydrolase [Caulobacter sp. SSI4214]
MPANGASRRGFLLGASALGLVAAVSARAADRAGLSRLADSFVRPPPESRPMARWWWFGGAVEAEEIVREIKAMKAGGFGGFEIQPVYPLSLDDPKLGVRNKPYLSKDFLDMVTVAARTGRAEGLRADITLGSGWPFGGPHIDAELAAARIVKLDLPAPGGVEALDLPALETGQRYVAAFVGTSPDDARAATIDGSRALFVKAETARTLYLVLQTRTRQQVKRASVGAEGFVLDHLNARAVRKHLEAVGEPLMAAFGDDRPYAVFSDSLEVYGANWTDDLLPEFEARRGYDLTPYLLDLFHDTGRSAGVRHDWGLTLSELISERYLTQVSAWAKSRQTLFRSQTYGTPAVTLSANRLVDLAEGEGAEWRKASSTRWASSANHLYGQPVTSAESFTWLHKGAFRATPLDIKAEADVLMLQGVNQFVVHGWPYSPPKVAEPGWALYAAAVFNDHNPWWPVMADVNLYLQRLSHLLRQGENVADVAIYAPTEDIMSGFKPGKGVSINDALRETLPVGIVEGLIDGGYNFDLIDGDAVLRRGIRHNVLLLPRIQRIAPEVYERIRAFAEAGGVVIAVGAPPSTAPGLKDAEARSRRVNALSKAVFGAKRAAITDEAGLIGVLNRFLPPDLGQAPKGVGYVHRRLADGDLYFVANTTNASIAAPLAFGAASKLGQAWSPVTGTIDDFRPGDEIRLAPFESRVFVFGRDLPASSESFPAGARGFPLSGGWRLRVGANARELPVRAFGSWTDAPSLQHFSGRGTYTREVELMATDLTAPVIMLDLGQGGPGAATEREGPGYYAQYDAPVRDAAEVFVNGQRAGAIWCAPFWLDVKPWLRAGRNRLEIRVYNTAINSLAGRPPTDYTALRRVYGDRFQPQNMSALKPLPSGLISEPALRFGLP